MSSSAPGDPAQPLTDRRILVLYLPLALSWLFMAAEAPISMSVISRLPNAEVNTAAFQIIMALAIFFESPVIDLLSTATTLGISRQNVEQLRRFTWMMMAITAIVHGAVAWTPLYEIVTLNILKTPEEVATAAHWPMRIMTLWAAAVGWRRFLQGLLIRRGMTKPLGFGTLIRVGVMATVGFGLMFTGWDGAVVASFALLASVVAEMTFVHIIAAPVIRELGPSDAPAVSLQSLAKFHFPLTVSTLLMLASMPIVSWALSQSLDPKANLGGWQVGFSLMWMFRTVTFALPEVVIALGGNSAARRTLVGFCLKVGSGCSLALFGFHFFGLDGWWFGQVLNASSTFIGLGREVMFFGALLPLLSAGVSCLRGFLTLTRVTSSRLLAVVVGFVSLFSSLLIGVQLKWPALFNGVLAINVSLIAECAALTYAWFKWGVPAANRQEA